MAIGKSSRQNLSSLILLLMEGLTGNYQLKIKVSKEEITLYLFNLFQEKQLKLKAIAENIGPEDGVVKSRVENIQSKTVDGAEVVQTPYVLAGYIRSNIVISMA